MTLSIPTRSSEDRYLAGVAGGVGHRFGFDPFFVRVALVGAVLLLGFGRGDLASEHVLVLGAYTLGWLVMPTESDRALLRRLRQREALQEIGAATLCFVLALVLVDNAGHIASVVLAGLASLLLGARRERWRPQPQSDPLLQPDLQDQPQAAAARPAEAQAVAPQAVAQLQRERLSARHRRIKRSPALWPLTLGLLLVAAVLLMALDSILTPGIAPGLIVSVALLLIGGVLLLSRWRGRAGGTALLAIPLIPLWLAFTVSGTQRFAGQGAVIFAPDSTGEDLSFEHGYGSATLDLTHLDLAAGSTTTVSLGLTAGSAELILPSSPDIELVVDAGLANIASYNSDYYRDGVVFSDSVEHSFSEVQWLRSIAYPECQLQVVPYEHLMWMVAEQIGPDVFPEPTHTPQELQAFGFDVEHVGGTMYRADEFVVLLAGDVLCDEARLRAETEPAAAQDNPATLFVEVSIGLGALEIHRG